MLSTNSRTKLLFKLHTSRDKWSNIWFHQKVTTCKQIHQKFARKCQLTLSLHSLLYPFSLHLSQTCRQALSHTHPLTLETEVLEQFFLLIEILEVGEVSACTYCSRDVGVEESFETETVIKKVVQTNLAHICVFLPAVKYKDGGTEGWCCGERSVLMLWGDDGDPADTSWCINPRVCCLPPSELCDVKKKSWQTLDSQRKGRRRKVWCYSEIIIISHSSTPLTNDPAQGRVYESDSLLYSLFFFFLIR